jgi:hypothetical protein
MGISFASLVCKVQCSQNYSSSKRLLRNSVRSWLLSVNWRFLIVLNWNFVTVGRFSFYLTTLYQLYWLHTVGWCEAVCMCTSNSLSNRPIQLTNLFHRAESFLRKQYFLSHSRNSQHCIESEGSLPCSQKHAILSYPGADKSSPHPFIIIF